MCRLVGVLVAVVLLAACSETPTQQQEGLSLIAPSFDYITCDGSVFTQAECDKIADAISDLYGSGEGDCIWAGATGYNRSWSETSYFSEGGDEGATGNFSCWESEEGCMYDPEEYLGPGVSYISRDWHLCGTPQCQKDLRGAIAHNEWGLAGMDLEFQQEVFELCREI